MTVDSDILKLGAVGTFIYDKDDPDSEPEFVGDYLVVDQSTKDQGTLNPLYKKNPSEPSRWDIVGFTRSQPGLGETTLNEKIRASVMSILERFKDRRCRVNIINAFNPCGAQDDIDGASSWQMIDAANLTSIEFTALGSLTAEDAEVNVNGPMSFLDILRIMPIRFTEIGGSTIDAEVLDLVISGAKSCGTCAPSSDGCTAYLLTRANPGSPGLSSQIVKVTEKNVVSEWDIPTLGGRSGSAIAKSGRRLIVPSEADGAHHYADRNNLTSWTRVATGYAVGGAPRKIWVGSAKQIIIGGAGGYIYKSRNNGNSVEVIHDGSLTTQNVNAVHGKGPVVLTAHDSNVLMLSTDEGNVFGLVETDAGVAGPEIGANLTAVWVKTRYWWEVGTNTGNLWYTADGGKTWAERTLPRSVIVINDIHYVEDELGDEVGYFCAEDLTTGYTFRTYTGGRLITDDPNVIDGLRTNRRVNAAASCGRNLVVVGGLLQGSTDGFFGKARG